MLRKTIWINLALLLTGLCTAMAQVKIPDFSFTDLEGNVFTQARLDLNLPTLVMQFDPYCDHCQQQAEWISAQADQFEDIQLVFVTIEPEKAPVLAFRDQYFPPQSWPHAYVLQDPNFKFEDYFGYTDSAVNLYLYKPGQKHPKYFAKEQAAEILLKFL